MKIAIKEGINRGPDQEKTKTARAAKESQSWREADHHSPILLPVARKSHLWPDTESEHGGVSHALDVQQRVVHLLAQDLVLTPHFLQLICMHREKQTNKQVKREHALQAALLPHSRPESLPFRLSYAPSNRGKDAFGAESEQRVEQESSSLKEMSKG